MIEREPHAIYFTQASHPRALAHRGLSRDGDENTRESFERALEAGADVIETDTRATSDGVALTFHDAHTGRVMTPDFLIERTRWSRLVDHKVGSGTLTRLSDALTLDRSALFNIDVKSVHAAVPAARAIVEADARERVCIASFREAPGRLAAEHIHHLVGAPVRRSAPQSVVAAFIALVRARAPRRAIARLLAPYAALQIPTRAYGIPLVTPASIAAAHAVGCEIHVWTIDDPAHMRSLLAQGVDGIVSNRVDILRRVIDEHGRAMGTRLGRSHE